MTSERKYFVAEWLAAAALLVALFSAIVPIRFPQLQMPKKELVVTQLGSVPLKNAQPQAPADDVKVMFGEQELKDPYIATLRIANTGDVELLPDQLRSLRVLAGTGRHFVRVRTIETRPAKINPTFEISKDVLTLVPLPLNRGQSITVAALVEGGHPIFDVEGEVLGAGPPLLAFAPPNKDQTPLRVFLFFALSIASFTFVFFNLLGLWLFRRTSSEQGGFRSLFVPLASGLLCTAGGYMAMRKGFEAIDKPDAVPTRLLVLLVAGVLSVSIHYWHYKRSRSKTA